MAIIEVRDVISALVGAGLVGAGRLILPRPARRLVRRMERLLGAVDVAVVIETDPAKMGVEGLDFATTFLFPPGFEPPAGPDAVSAWWSWAHNLGGVDVRLTEVLVTLQGVEDAAVLVGMPTVKCDSREVPEGVVCFPEGLGGGGVAPRRYDVRLSLGSPPAVSYVDESGRPAAFTLAKGETEQIAIVASAESGFHTWTCVVPVTVNGVMRSLEIDCRGEPFRTTAMRSDLQRRMWADERWQ